MQQIETKCIIRSVSQERTDEAALIERIKRDPSAFGVIFDTHYSKILSYALKRVGDAEVAEDIVAQTFLKAFRHIGRYRFEGTPISSWLYRIAGNEVKMYFRKPRRQLSLESLREEGFDVPEIISERELLNDLVLKDQEFTQVMGLLRTLPHRQQEAIVLRYIEEKEMAEIALIMRCKEVTVRSFLSRGFSRLRALHLKQQKDIERIIESEGRSVLSV
jgi:RNA polymerase sigma-70 factor, ECF subfamily